MRIKAGRQRTKEGQTVHPLRFTDTTVETNWCERGSGRTKAPVPLKTSTASFLTFAGTPGVCSSWVRVQGESGTALARSTTAQCVLLLIAKQGKLVFSSRFWSREFTNENKEYRQRMKFKCPTYWMYFILNFFLLKTISSYKQVGTMWNLFACF